MRSIEEAGSFAIHRRECLLSNAERVPPVLCADEAGSSTHRRGTPSLLWEEGTLSVVQRRSPHPPHLAERHPLLCGGEGTLPPYSERGLPPPCIAYGHFLPCMEGTTSLLYRVWVCLLCISQSGTLPRVERRHSLHCVATASVFSTHRWCTPSPVWRGDTPPSVQRRGLPPLYHTVGHPLLCVWGDTLSYE